MDRSGVVYQIENKINGMLYIGQTIHYDKRIKEHLKWRKSNRHNSLLKMLQKKTYAI